MGQFDQLALDPWQALLDRHTEVFGGIQTGARIGVLSKDDFEPPATMLVWQAADRGMQASYEPFPGFEQVNIDLLFVADEATIISMYGNSGGALLKEMKGKLRRRDILLYVVKPHGALLEAGYEHFLESLGLPVLGTCR